MHKTKTPAEYADELFDRQDDGSRTAAPSDQVTLDEFGPVSGAVADLFNELRDAKHALEHFDSAVRQGFLVPGPDRPALVARVEAVEKAIDEHVAKCREILGHEADEIRGRGGDFLYIASKLDKELAEIEKLPAVSSAMRYHLPRIERHVLPGLREDLAKAEFNAVSVAVDEEPLSRVAAAVWEILLELPTDPPTGMTGPALVRELKKREVPTSEPTFRSYAVPELKNRGMKNKPKVGYYLPKSARKDN